MGFVSICAGASQQVRIEYQWVGLADPGAPVLVFLHEGLGSISMWRDFPHRLCQVCGCRGLVYSRPGYGKSTPRPTDENWAPDFMHRQANEVLPALLAALHIDARQRPVWLVGHSDGGSIALIHAATHPDSVAGLVVLAPHIMVEEISIASIAQTRSAYLETDLKQRLARHHDNPDSAFWGWNNIWLHPKFRSWNIETAVADVTCPLLAIQGVNDPYGTLAQIRRIALLAPQTELLELPACGHSPHREQTEQVLAATGSFFQKITGESTSAR